VLQVCGLPFHSLSMSNAAAWVVEASAGVRALPIRLQGLPLASLASFGAWFCPVLPIVGSSPCARLQACLLSHLVPCRPLRPARRVFGERDEWTLRCSPRKG
jgi:hypothetical protein